MDRPSGAGASPRFLYRDPADLQTPVGRAINGEFLADEEAVVRRLADAARLDEAATAAIQRVDRCLDGGDDVGRRVRRSELGAALERSLNCFTQVKQGCHRSVSLGMGLVRVGMVTDC